MAGQIRWLRRAAVLPCHPSGLIPFPFGFNPCRLVKMAFFFFCFFVLKIIFERELRILINGQLSKQWLVLIVIDFLNQFSELLKVVLDNVVQIRINRQFVNSYNVGKPVKCFVVFLPYID